MKVLSLPGIGQLGDGESGIHTVIRNYYKHGPEFGIDFVDSDSQSFDVLAIHAGMAGRYPANGPICSHVHGLYWTADYDMGMWASSANRKVIDSVRHALVTTVPSRWVAEAFERDMRFTPDVLPHGVDWDSWQHDTERGDVVIGYAKNRAGIDVCNPEFIPALASRFPNLDVVATFAPDNSPDNVKVTGVIPHGQMRRIVQMSRVFVNTTKETWGIGMLEAMAAGTPVLAYDHGGARELVEHGVTGYLARPGDTEDLADGMAYCLSHWKVLGENARDAAREYSWEKAVAQLAGIYQRAMDEYAKPSTVGIVIPVYNKPIELIARAVNSALAQGDVEVAIVDDGSVDQGPLDRFLAERPSNVTYIKQENSGVAVARDAGISALKDCKYVMCLDSDDWIDEGYAAACAAALDLDNSLGMAYTPLRWAKPDGSEGMSLWPGPFNFDKFVGGDNQVHTAAMFRREAWLRTGGFHERYAPFGAGEEDANFWLRIGSIGYGGKLVESDSLFRYSWESGYVSGNRDHMATDWRFWLPWTRDNKHPFASVASPENSQAHKVNQYDEPGVSVIIPVGPGHQKYLPNALDSLEAQTFRRWEAIVSWDCIPNEDEYNWLVRAYPYAKHVYAYSDGSVGAGAARNLAVDNARAGFLLFLDADDHLHPDCMTQFLEAYGVTNNAIYSDYVGKAYVEDPSQLDDSLQAAVIDYDERTNIALIGHRAANYDCEAALRQPQNPPYIWNNVTTLIPRAWHYEIGGFDEKMESWEDVDYWWRMAWAGKCFTRIEKELMLYRFHTGARRRRGLNSWDELLTYMKEKKQGIEIMGCGCQGGKTLIRNGNDAAAKSATVSARSVDTVNDNDMTMIKYMHPNRGQHPVYGAATKTFYGFRSGAGTESFLVNNADIAAFPSYFVPMQAVPSAPALPQAPPREPVLVSQPPQPVATEPPPLVGDTPPALVETEPPKMIEVDVAGEPEPAKVALDNARFDLQTLPGITPEIATDLAAGGYTTPQSILDAGVRSLFKIRGVGPARAKMIFEHVKATYG